MNEQITQELLMFGAYVSPVPIKRCPCVDCTGDCTCDLDCESCGRDRCKLRVTKGSLVCSSEELMSV